MGRYTILDEHSDGFEYRYEIENGISVIYRDEIKSGKYRLGIYSQERSPKISMGFCAYISEKLHEGNDIDEKVDYEYYFNEKCRFFLRDEKRKPGALKRNLEAEFVEFHLQQENDWKNQFHDFFDLDAELINWKQLAKEYCENYLDWVNQKSDLIPDSGFGFESPLSESNLKKIYPQVIDKYIVGSLANFIAMCRNTRLPVDFQKIIWIMESSPGKAHKTALRWFLETLLEIKSPSQKNVDHCFTDKKGDKISLVKRKDSGTDPNKNDFIALRKSLGI